MPPIETLPGAWLALQSVLAWTLGAEGLLGPPAPQEVAMSLDRECQASSSFTRLPAPGESSSHSWSASWGHEPSGERDRMGAALVFV